MAFITRSLKRKQLRRALNRFESGITADVCYLGGSITNGSGSSSAGVTSWRAQLSRYLDLVYLDSTLTHHNAGIAGTPSWYGLVRLQADVVDNSPELVVLDFAVNDRVNDGDGARSDGFAPAAEAVIRRLRADLPNTTLLGWIFTWPDNYSSMAANHRAARNKWIELARRYGIPLLRWDLEIERVYGTTTPTDAQVDVYLAAVGDLHPNDLGHRLAAHQINRHCAPFLADADTTAQAFSSVTRYYSEAEDYEETPTITNGIDHDGTTGAWAASGTAMTSSTVDSTIQFDATCCSFGLDTNYGGGAGTLAYKIDAGGYTEIDLSAEDQAINPVYNFTRAARTITIKVVSGSIEINRFLAV